MDRPHGWSDETRVATASNWSPATVALLAALAVSGAASVALMTRLGIGTSPDSVGYLQAARAIVESGPGAVLTGETEGIDALTQFGPLYAFVLAMGGLGGLDPYDWARWLQAALFGANLALVSILIREATRPSSWPWLAGTVLALSAPSLLSLHATLLSEPLFLLLTLLGLWRLSRFLAGAGRQDLVAAAAAMGLALLTRYAGAAGILAALLALLFNGRRSAAHRLGDCLIFGAISSAGMIAWMARNALVAESATGRELLFHPVGSTHLWQAARTVSGWLLLPAWLSGWPQLLALLTAAVVCAAAWIIVGSRQAPPVLVRTLGLFAVTYLTFLALSISVVDANTPLDERILSPAYLVGLVVLGWLARELMAALGDRPALRAGLGLTLAVLVTVQFVQGTRLMAATRQGGWGFSSAAWQASPTIAQLPRLSDAVVVYTNAPEVIYLHTGRHAQALPRPWLAMSQRPNPHYEAEMQALVSTLLTEPSVVVVFTGIRGGTADTRFVDLASRTSLRTWDSRPDGLILCATCPE